MGGLNNGAPSSSVYVIDVYTGSVVYESSLPKQTIRIGAVPLPTNINNGYEFPTFRMFGGLNSSRLLSPSPLLEIEMSYLYPVSNVEISIEQYTYPAECYYGMSTYADARQTIYYYGGLTYWVIPGNNFSRSFERDLLILDFL